jgi:RNA polymerase sigma-70 factor (ECF subfamily)
MQMDAQDAAAVAQVLAGDRDAFRLLVERHSRSVFRLAYRLTGSESDADDVVQETFLRAYAKLATYQHQASFKTWLCRIAANYSMDMMAKRKHETAMPTVPGAEGEPEREFEVAGSAPGPERLLLSVEMQEAMRGGIESLTYVERTAFVMRHFEGCSIEEISTTLHQSIGSAKNTVFRAVQKMRRSLAPFVREEAAG